MTLTREQIADIRRRRADDLIPTSAEIGALLDIAEAVGSIRALGAKWREHANEQDDRAGATGLTDAERSWHVAISQQAEECADELEAVLPLAGEAGK